MATAQLPATTDGRRRPARPIAWFLLLALLVPVAVGVRVVHVAQRDDREPVDAIVVLGAAATNGVAGHVLQARLQQALDLHSAGVAPVVVTAGGVGEGQRLSEAEVGAQWLVERGVPAEAVVAVGSGGDTLTSLQAVAAEQRVRGWGTVLLVSDPWHLYRSRAMAEDVGLPVAGTSPVPGGPNVDNRGRAAFNVVRETAAFLAYRAGTLAGDAAGAVDDLATGR
ncbi:MAG: YdcF family protein [Actinomycetales bacterium]